MRGLMSSNLSHRPCWTVLSPTVFLCTSLTQPLRHPWRIHLRQHGHRGRPRRSHLWSSSTAGRSDLCASRGTSTFGGVDTVDDLKRSPLRSSSVAGRSDLCTTPGTSTTSVVAIVDELLEPTAAGSLLPHHDIDSSRGHRLSHRFQHLQPHHFQCR
jgi:hypothetical protein